MFTDRDLRNKRSSLLLVGITPRWGVSHIDDGWLPWQRIGVDILSLVYCGWHWRNTYGGAVCSASLRVQNGLHAFVLVEIGHGPQGVVRFTPGLALGVILMLFTTGKIETAALLSCTVNLWQKCFIYKAKLQLQDKRYFV